MSANTLCAGFAIVVCVGCSAERPDEQRDRAARYLAEAAKTLSAKGEEELLTMLKPDRHYEGYDCYVAWGLNYRILNELRRRGGKVRGVLEEHEDDDRSVFLGISGPPLIHTVGDVCRELLGELDGLPASLPGAPDEGKAAGGKGDRFIFNDPHRG